jgi:hypothetical protein
MDVTPQPPQSDDDWLLSPSTTPAAEAAEAAPEPDGGTEVLASGPAPGGRRTLLAGSALAVVGLVAGAAGTFALSDHGPGTTTLRNASSTTQQGPASIPGFRPRFQDGTGAAPGGGGVAGEQRVQGTLTSVGSSSITVKTASGTATYTVTSSTQILRDGRPATLSDLKAGDPVFLHAYPSNGKTVAERVFAGTLSQGSFPGGPGAPGGFAPGGTDTTQAPQPSGVING